MERPAVHISGGGAFLICEKPAECADTFQPWRLETEFSQIGSQALSFPFSLFPGWRTVNAF
jgi:hypothetical protein